MSMGESMKPVLLAAASAAIVAILGALMTDIGPWYRSLVQPAWKPPDWAFGPAWTLIFACAAWAGVTGWMNAPDAASRDWLLALFGFNAFFNLLWSLLYFRLHRPDWALLEVVVLWLSVLVLMVVLGRYSSKAAWLLAPYLVWVAFAGVLNWHTVKLNGPF
jgi:translocator protein